MPSILTSVMCGPLRYVRKTDIIEILNRLLQVFVMAYMLPLYKRKIRLATHYVFKRRMIRHISSLPRIYYCIVESCVTNTIIAMLFGAFSFFFVLFCVLPQLLHFLAKFHQCTTLTNHSYRST